MMLVLLIVLISVALRYPLVEHERHNDTFSNRLLALSILENDYSLWTFHPLSYVGYYPISYPSGNAFLLAEISEMAGIGLSPSIMTLGMLSGIVFALSVFCLSRVLLRRIDLCLLATILAVSAPRFIDMSYWSGSARAPFVALMVLVVFFAFRFGFSGRPAVLIVLGIAVTGCFMLHHMAVVFILFLLAYVLSASLSRVTALFTSSHALTKASGWFTGLAVVLVGIAFLVLAGSYLTYYNITLEQSYASTSLFSFEPAYLSTVLNMAASYTNQIGLVLPIAVLSLPVYFLRVKPTTTSLFPVLLLISFIPLLPRAEYITMILSPFVAVLAVVWFDTALKRRRWRRVVMTGLVIVICASFILPVWSIQRWNDVQERSGDSIASDSQLFIDAEYLRSFQGEAYAISNVDILSERLAGVSGIVFLKSGLLSALSGDVTAESVDGNLSMANRHFPQNIFLWFEYEDEYDISLYVSRYLTQGSQFPAGEDDVWQPDEDYFEKHSRLLVVVDNRSPDVYIWTWGITGATLPSELRDAQWHTGTTTYPLESYSIYMSGRITLYATEVPDGY